MMVFRSIPAAVVAIVLALLGGCSSGGAKSDTIPGDHPGSPAASRMVDSPAASAAPATSKQHRLGATVPVRDGVVTVTVLAYRQPGAPTAPKPDTSGNEWAALRVKVCQANPIPDGATASEDPWSLVDADGGLTRPSSIKYRQFPTPEYPIEPHMLQVGRCISGWIVFEVTKSAHQVTAEYAPQDLAPIDWVLT